MMEATYRYTLTRALALTADGVRRKRICWVMLNPSTADEFVNDPTIRRVIGFSRRDGFDDLVVVNLFAARSTDPKNLELFDDPVGPGNSAAVSGAFEVSTQVVFAWGAGGIHCMKAKQEAEMRRMLTIIGKAPLCLGRTKDGSPRHPLYVPAATRLEPY